jgi:hypothetical protein
MFGGSLFFIILKQSLQDKHETNAYSLVISVCLSVRVMQLENLWMGLVEICYCRHAIGDHPKIVLLNFLQ